MASRETRNIAVYADWEGLGGPLRLGDLRVHGGMGKEIFEFEYDAPALAHPQLLELYIDPNVKQYAGRQYAGGNKTNFGVFLDSSPDRWGRLLMQRRLDRAKRAGESPAGATLSESDYLLGVHDAFRAGALRFRLEDEGPFLDADDGKAAPPFVQLRALEEASRAIESDKDGANVDEWLRILVAPGASLGGARPKASVVDTQGRLWIAKFPSVRDTRNVGAWELVVVTLARACGLNAPNARAQCFASSSHTFLTPRFDRTESGKRLHFASAMTLTGRSDGADATAGASYLELAEVLMSHGAEPDADLRELWSRIVFNMCVSNTDDHLRNHGFILTPRRGWRLSPLYDVNPVPHGDTLTLNVSETDNSKDLELALEAAPLFRVKAADAEAIVQVVTDTVRRWPEVATKLYLGKKAQEEMARAFALAD